MPEAVNGAGRVIDLNSDLGESFGPYQIGYDADLFPLISSANVACGFHGGDPRVIERTITAATSQQVAVGAHPGYPDLVGFGRREIDATPDEIRTDTLYQIGAVDAFCRAAQLRLQHVKVHGALYHSIIKADALAQAVADAIVAYDRSLIVLAQPGTRFFAAAAAAGLKTAREGFADRAYNADGTLVSRKIAGAMIDNPEVAAERALRLVTEGVIETIDGQDLALSIDSLCIHSDTPGALEMATAIRHRFDEAGISVRPFGAA